LLTARSRVCEVVWCSPKNNNLWKQKGILEEYLSQAAFFSWAPNVLRATLTARVVSCREALVGW